MTRLATAAMLAALSAWMAAGATNTVAVHETFDNWEWIPIVPSTAQSLRRQMEETGDTHFLELRGPVVRQPVGYALFAHGKMTAGRDAGAGQAIHFKTEKIRYEIGLHGPFSGRLKMGHAFAYDVWLKGDGRFRVHVWIGGADKKTLAQKYGGAPRVIDVAVGTNAWTHYQGRFALPRENDSMEYNHEQSFAIVIEPGTDLHVDDFRIVDLGEVR